MIHFNCGNCGKTLRVGDDTAGKRGKCPGCQEPFMVPAAGGPPPRPGATSAPAPPPRPSRPAAPAIYAPAMGLREAAPSPTPAPATRHAQDSYADVPQARFSYSGARRAKSFLLGGGMILAGLVLIGFIFLGLQDAQGGGGRNVGRGVLLGLVLVVSGIVFLVNALMHREMEAATSPEGLSLSVGDQNNFVRWCDIKEVRQVRNQFDGGGIWSSIYAKSQGKDRVLVVQDLAGSKLEFTNFLENLDQLAELVERTTCLHLWPSALQALAAGQTLDFGQLKLNQTGLWIKPDAPLAWADVAQITSESEHLKIKANGKWLHWFSAPLGTIPNGHVFLQVAEYCRAQPGGVFAASGAPAEFPAPFAGTPSAGNQGAGNANAVWGTTTPATPTSMMSRPMQIITGVFLCFLGLIFISVMISLSKQRNNNAFVITFFMAMGMLAIIGGGWLGIKALLRKS